jgi:hypothetical protein
MKAIAVVGVIAAVFWVFSAWVMVNSLLGDRLPPDPNPVRQRVEAVKAGKYLSAKQLAECKYGETVAIRGPVQQIGRTSDSHAFVVVNGVVCRMIQYLVPKCQPDQVVVVAGRWDGRALSECAVYARPVELPIMPTVGTTNAERPRVPAEPTNRRLEHGPPSCVSRLALPASR